MKTMTISKYINIQAIKTKDNKLIPILNDGIKFDDSEFDTIGNKIRFDGNNYFDVVECVFDLETKKIIAGIELEHYPIEDNLEFKKGQIVLYEKSYRKLEETSIVDIVYEEFDMEIKKGENFDNYDIDKFKNVEIVVNKLYILKFWKPFYILDNGVKIKYNHEIYHKA